MVRCPHNFDHSVITSDKWCLFNIFSGGLKIGLMAPLVNKATPHGDMTLASQLTIHIVHNGQLNSFSSEDYFIDHYFYFYLSKLLLHQQYFYTIGQEEQLPTSPAQLCKKHCWTEHAVKFTSLGIYFRYWRWRSYQLLACPYLSLVSSTLTWPIARTAGWTAVKFLIWSERSQYYHPVLQQLPSLIFLTHYFLTHYYHSEVVWSNIWSIFNVIQSY